MSGGQEGVDWDRGVRGQGFWGREVLEDEVLQTDVEGQVFV